MIQLFVFPPNVLTEKWAITQHMGVCQSFLVFLGEQPTLDDALEYIKKTKRGEYSVKVMVVLGEMTPTKDFREDRENE